MQTQSGTPFEVLRAFARLGLTCFGGPVAHLGYFRTEFVDRRCWLDDREYAEVMGLCQFLPGPMSSQVGFALGLLRAGPLGGLAAWAGFTLPSALLMTGFAAVSVRLNDWPPGLRLLHGLKLVAAAVVAQAVWSLARTLCPDRTRASLAAAACVLAVLAPASVGQVAAIVAGAVAGLFLCRGGTEPDTRSLPEPLSRRAGAACLAVFAILLAGLPLLRGTALFDAFYRSGALVFGGGHVVLPLLRDAVVVPGWVSAPDFLAGYGAAQAMPGPLFTVAAFLGARASAGPGGIGGAALATIAIFLPGLLLLAGALPFWGAIRRRPWSRAMVAGANAAVVGLLLAALYDPVWTGAVTGPADFAAVVVGVLLLTVWQAPPLLVVVLGAAAALLL